MSVAVVVYMQVHALSEIDDDVVSWDPKFTYESYGPCVTPPNESGPPGGCVSNPPPALVFQRSTDFRVADRDFVGWQAPAWGTVRVEGTVTLGGTTPRTLTVYRRRSALPFDPAAAPPSEAAISAHLGAAPDYAQDPIASVTLNPGVNSLVGGAAIELAHTQLGDQLLFHVSVDRDVDPSTVSAWDLNVRYTSFCLNPASEDNCRTVEPCGVDPHWVGSGTSNRVCALGGAPRSGSEPWRIGETLIVRATIPSIDWLPPSTAGIRKSTEVGWWRNWGVFAWNGSQPAPLDQFHESGMKEPFGAGTSAQSAFDAWRMGGPLPAPRSVPLAPRFTADELRVGTGSVSLAAGHWRGGGVDAFVTSSSLKPSAMSTSRVGPTGEIESWTSSRDRYTTAPVMRQSESESHGSHISVGPISSNSGETTHRTIRDFVDMNGDGLPDSVAAYDSGVMQVQFLKRRVAGAPVSEFEAVPVGVSSRAAAGLRRSEGKTQRGAFSGTVAIPSGRSGGGTSASPSDTKAETRGGEFSSTSVRVGIGSAVSTSNTKRDLMDINGDGLPDLVEIRPANNPMLAPATMVVQYNLGYRMSNPVSMQVMWPANEASDIGFATRGLRMQQSCSFEGSFGFWFAGAGTTHGDSVNYSSMVDMNADGLPDLMHPLTQPWRKPGQA